MHDLKLTINLKDFRMYYNMTSPSEIKRYAKKLSEIYHGYKDSMCQFLQGNLCFEKGSTCRIDNFKNFEIFWIFLWQFWLKTALTTAGFIIYSGTRSSLNYMLNTDFPRSNMEKLFREQKNGGKGEFAGAILSRVPKDHPEEQPSLFMWVIYNLLTKCYQLLKYPNLTD